MSWMELSWSNISGMASSMDGYLSTLSCSESPILSAHRCEPTLVICCGVLMPATTSSPCALTKYSPLNIFSPFPASRLKHTPVADVSPIFPKTIAMTLTAVPHSSGIPSIFL